MEEVEKKWNKKSKRERRDLESLSTPCINRVYSVNKVSLYKKSTICIFTKRT